MHVIAHVGGDPGEVRRVVTREVGAELREWDDVRRTAARVAADVVVVDERIVLLHVWIGVADEAARGHAFHVRLPGATARLNLVGDVRRIDVAARAITGNPEGAARGQGEVVGKARVTHGVVPGRQTVAGGQAVDIGGRAIPYDRR